MKAIYQSLRFYSRLVSRIGLYALGLLYSCQGAHQLGMEPGETAEITSVSETQETAIATFLPQVRQDPHNEGQAYCEVSNLSDSNIPEINLASAMTMARIVQQAKAIQPILVTNHTHLQENRANEIQYLETTCGNLFGNVDNLRRYQNHILVGINQAPPQTRLSDMRTWFRQMGSPTMHILADRICLYDPLNQSTDNPDFWSTERFKEEIARIPRIPKAIAANLYRSMLSDNDKVVLQRYLNHQVAAVRNALIQNNDAAVNQYWDFIKKGRTIAPNAIVALSGQELLSMKLNVPTAALDTVDSAAVVHYCAELGDQNVLAYNDKNAIAILGETGSGKSTATNYWMGRDMVRRTSEELEATGIQGGLEDVVVVDPESTHPEAASIGHSMVSHTLMPKMLQDPNQTSRVYVDCPGFSDNRGAEINIANAINIRKGLQRVNNVKAVFLISYPSLRSSRGKHIRDLAHMGQQLFGGVDNLRNHQNAVLLGINRAPAQASIESVRTWLTGMNSPAIQILGQRAFLYDPLEQGGADFWSRDRFLTEIEQMPAIPREVASTMFRTVLTGDDKVMLQQIVEHQVEALCNALEQNDYPAADRCWSLINQLQIIAHQRIDELMNRQVRPHMRAYAEERTATFARHAAQHQFTEAAQLLTLLRTLNERFPDEHLVDLEELAGTLQAARAQQAAQQEAEERRQREAEARQRAEEEAQKAEEARARAQRAREEMEARVRRQEAVLNAERRRRPNIGFQVQIEVPCVIQ